MPRIYDSASNALDFCRRCFPDMLVARRVYGNERITGAGPDGRGNCFSYEDEHPDYDQDEYSCETCHRPLTGADD